MMGNGFSDAAHQEFFQTLFSMQPENDHIRVPIFGNVEDFCSYLILRYA